MPLFALRQPVFALFQRALRTGARAHATYLLRAGATAFLFLGLWQAIALSNVFGAPGLRLFWFIAGLDFALITLLGFSYLATSITEEREENALGLLRMTNLNSAAILLGKTGGRLIAVGLLLLVQFPITFGSGSISFSATRRQPFPDLKQPD